MSRYQWELGYVNHHKQVKLQKRLTKRSTNNRCITLGAVLNLCRNRTRDGPLDSFMGLDMFGLLVHKTLCSRSWGELKSG